MKANRKMERDRRREERVCGEELEGEGVEVGEAAGEEGEAGPGEGLAGGGLAAGGGEAQAQLQEEGAGPAGGSSEKGARE